MTVTSRSPATDQVAPPISLQEWLRLRRHPRPEFYSLLQEVPHHLLSAAQPWLPPDGVIQGALVLPGEYYARKKVHWEWVPERALIFLDGSALHVSSGTAGAAPEVMAIDARSLLYLRSSLLLLYGLLEFKADCGGQTGEVRLEYNTVIWELLRRPLARFVAAAGLQPQSVDDAELQGRNASLIKSLPYKFANGVRYYVLEPGERLEAATFQPAIWERRGLLPNQVTPNTLFALTDRKLVLIEENRSSFWQKRRSGTEYGWIFTYIPLERVVEIGAAAQGVRWTEFTIRLEWGGAQDERKLLLEPAIAARWEQAWLAAQGG